MEITFRKAIETDIDFITEGIIHAELSGGKILPYSAIFGLTETETKLLIEAVIEEEIEGQEWYLPNFHILEVNKQSACCLSNWIEANNGTGSGLLKAQAMAWILREKWTEASKKLACLKGTQLPRIQQALQLECIYTKKEFRGHGLASKLIEHSIYEWAATPNKPKMAEIQLLANNEAALRSYTKCGFLLRAEATSTDPEILNLLAHHTRVSLTKIF
jgi:GNAT superfamily N-acetyltransferase